MHKLIVSPFLDTHLILCPGQPNAINISRAKYAQLQSIWTDESRPDWLSDAVMKSWGVDIRSRPLRDLVIVRAPSLLGYGRASYELNMGCNYDCKHCYLGLKEFAGLDWLARERILDSMQAAGVLWLQLTGGEPTIDGFGIKYRDYRKMSPTIYGGAETLASQSLPHLTVSKPFTGCDAGHTSFHVDPHGRASICKVGREPNIALADEGIEGLHRLGVIADQLLRRQGGCTGCTLSAQCGTCMPLADKYRQAKAPLNRYCQHGERR